MRGFPVGRVFCVGRNYAAHAAEMGSEVDREAPFYFTKSATHAVASGQTVPYPPGTEDYHHEMELVVALRGPLFRTKAADLGAAILGYGCGLDMTRRDLQAVSKSKRRPWDTGKDVEGAAVLGPLTAVPSTEQIGDRAITLTVNDTLRQSAILSDMVHSVPEILADLSRLYHLRPGDVVMTGTPAGVGPVQPGDRLHGQIDGLQDVTMVVGPAP